MKKTGLVLGLLAGILVAGTVSVQLTVGVVIIAVCTSLLLKSGISLDQIDDTVIAELKNVLNRE